MTAAGPGRRIDRRALVDRHAVEVTRIMPDSPLSVGNGELCFTVDVTGLQTFPGRYPVEDPSGARPGTLLATMSSWGWHSTPVAPSGPYGLAGRGAPAATTGGEPSGPARHGVPGREPYDLAETLRVYRTPRGQVPYVDMRGDLGAGTESPASAAESWLRNNPHRLDLARIGLVVTGDGEPRPPDPDELSEIRQRLDLWAGTIVSRLRLRGTPVTVTTVCHPERDVLALRIETGRPAASPDGALAVRLAFPYGSESWSNAADWSRPEAHSSTVRPIGGGHTVERVLDGTTYHLILTSSPPGAEIVQTGRHELVVACDSPVTELSIAFGPGGPGAEGMPAFAGTLAASARHWERFWTGGGAVELAGSRDGRAPELERRVVLSQYLTAINCAGSRPPQETGLMVNSWRGRFHLEMHWWHGAHFPLWGRSELLERSLGWYAKILPAARETARRQGCSGARWPKQAGPDGRESPSPIGPFLIWQQPHPIFLAELVRRGTGSAETLRRHAGIVLESAAFMADFAVKGPDGYRLGPPLVPAQESYADRRAELGNPTFELAYWAWALGVAQRWRALLGLAPEPSWDRVAEGLARPCVRDGIYAAVDAPPYTLLGDHPSMLYALGFVPPTGLIDPEIMRATLHHVLDVWPWETTWGWDYPAIAMTATRLGEPETALSALLMPVPKNEHLPNGHNRQTPSLPIYLPGNGGLLSAVALMARGWDGDGGRPAPGFPAGGTWTVRHEGLHPSP